MAAHVVDTLVAALGPQADGRGFELVAVESTGSAGAPLIRVYLDRDGGIDLETVAEANAWIAETIEATGAVRGAYTLEVSSPGIERPLRTLEHFKRFTGSDARIRTTRTADGRSRYTGTIIAVEGTDIILDVDGERVRIPHGSITKAHLKVDFGDISEGSRRTR